MVWLPSTVTSANPSSPMKLPLVMSYPLFVSAVPSYGFSSLFAVISISTGLIVTVASPVSVVVLSPTVTSSFTYTVYSPTSINSGFVVLQFSLSVEYSKSPAVISSFA